MSFFTSLTGLNAATTQLAVTSNNIANAGTTGFKRSRSDFGDIFATSPLQKASTVVGQGTALKTGHPGVFSGKHRAVRKLARSWRLLVRGSSRFALVTVRICLLGTVRFFWTNRIRSSTRPGQYLQVASVDSLGKADFEAALVPLQIAPNTVGEALATSAIDLEINFPGKYQSSLPDRSLKRVYSLWCRSTRMTRRPTRNLQRLQSMTRMVRTSC